MEKYDSCLFEPPKYEDFLLYFYWYDAKLKVILVIWDFLLFTILFKD